MRKTLMRIFVAKCMYRFVKLFLKNDIRTIRRNGINYEINLSEGIDFSLFLFGGFQKNVIGSSYYSIPQDAVVFDIGANIGGMSLPLAKKVNQGKVFSFEPTHLACAKFAKNVSLNSDLAQRVSLINTFVSDKLAPLDTSAVYASWSLSDNASDNKHQIHGGIKQNSSGVGVITIDEVVSRENLKRLDFIKIDTDGHEIFVLKGGADSIAKFKPVVVFEVGDYLLKERGVEFPAFLKFFSNLNYSLFCTRTKRVVREDNFHKIIPTFSTTDLIAIPN